MLKIDALFTIPVDKKLLISQVRDEILPLLYQMPYIDKIELTPYYETPTEIQAQYTDQPIYYQIAIYIKELDEVIKAFGTDSGLELTHYLIHTFEDQLITAVGDAKVFYRSDLELIQNNQLFPQDTPQAN